MEEFWISPSKIECFRKYAEGEMFGHITEAKVVEAVMGTTPYTPQANFGSAYHAVIEHGCDKYLNPKTGLYHIKDSDMPSEVILDAQEVAPGVAYRERYPHLKFENWLFHSIYVDNFKVVFIMRVDGLDGLRIHENKTSTWPANEEEYYRSVQWKMYMDAIPAQCVQYNHFFYTQRGEHEGRYDVEYNDWRFYRYPGMSQEIREYCYGLVRFCTERGLRKFLYRRPR